VFLVVCKLGIHKSYLVGTFATPNHINVVTVANSSVKALQSNQNRKYALFANTSDTIIYLQLGTPSSDVMKDIPLYPSGGSYELTRTTGNLFTGDIYVTCTAAEKVLMVTEGL